MVNASLPLQGDRQERSNAARHFVEVQTLQESYVRANATARYTRSRNEDQQQSGLPHLMNHESRMRLMIERLNSLSNRITELRSISSGVATTPSPMTARALARSVSGFDTSLEMLDCAIEDLELTVTTTARQVERDVQAVSNRSSVRAMRLSSALSNDFISSPARSLLSRARRNQFRQSGNDMLDDAQSLDSRLETFSTNLDALNMRLDRVARSFREIHGRSQVPMSDSPPFSELSREELEFQRRLNALPESIASQGLLPLSRRVLQQSSRVPRQSAVRAPRPLIIECPKVCPQGATLHTIADAEQSDPVAKMCVGPSSHTPISRAVERKFVYGIEYRNCLGLWLSQDGHEAPGEDLL